MRGDRAIGTPEARSGHRILLDDSDLLCSPTIWLQSRTFFARRSPRDSNAQVSWFHVARKASCGPKFVGGLPGPHREDRVASGKSEIGALSEIED